MEEIIKLSDDVIEKIKDFDHSKLTEEQNLLIDNLILNEKLKKRYKKYGLCKQCKQPNTDFYYDPWCQLCIAKRFQQNFKNWTSGNRDIDKFIQTSQLNAKNYKVLEWIEYNKFDNIQYLAQGGFGTTYKADWKEGCIKSWNSENNRWNRWENKKVALKCLHNSQNITAEFLKEIESYISMSFSSYVVRCYGITKDLKTNNFIMVMKYAENGSLRQHLNNRFNSMRWHHKLITLKNIANGLKIIHSKDLIHRDFHCSNILNSYNNNIYITDLGLCQPANVKQPSQDGNKKIYGVLPYVAPEVLRGKRYTQASDIYGFGIVAYEVCTGLPPYHDMAHEDFLATRICQGLRPNSNYKIPQLILDVINQCWDADPIKRPNAKEVYDSLWKLTEMGKQENSSINKQIKEAHVINEKLSSSSYTGITLSYTTHPQAVYTSKLLDFKNLPEPKNANEYSESIKIDFTKLNLTNSKDET